MSDKVWVRTGVYGTRHLVTEGYAKEVGATEYICKAEVAKILKPIMDVYVAWIKDETKFNIPIVFDEEEANKIMAYIHAASLAIVETKKRAEDD